MFRLNIGPEGTIDDFHIIVAFRDHRSLQLINGVTDFEINTKLNGADTISFNVYKYLDKSRHIIDPMWDQICDLKFVYIPEVNEYFELQIKQTEEHSLVKNVIGTAAGEAELSQSIINSLEINTEADILRNAYNEFIPTFFYRPKDPKNSLLHRTLDKLPQWSIGHVDDSLWNIQRTLSCNGQSVYDFLTGDVAEKFGCLFIFDSVKREINAYDLRSTCLQCGERGFFHIVCPKCGCSHLDHFGEETTVFIDVDNFGKQIVFETDVDSIKNCFYLKSGDDNYDAAIRDRNPNGSQYIYRFSRDMRHDMPKPLLELLHEYDKLHRSYLEEYEQLTIDYRYWHDQEFYLRHSMMPTPNIVQYSAQDTADRLSSVKLSPIGVVDLDERTSRAFIENKIKSYASVYCHTGMFRLKVNTTSWNNPVWTGTITVTNRNKTARDEWGNTEYTDVATTVPLTITAVNDYVLSIEQGIEEMARKQEEKDEYGCIFEILTIRNPEAMKEAVALYSYHRLISIRDAFQACIDIMHGVVHDIPRAELYETIYTNYLELLGIINDEVALREKQVDEANRKWHELHERRLEIQKELNMPKFLGDHWWKVFCMYIREDTYENRNYISDGFSDEEMLQDVENYYHSAIEELFQSSEYQHTLSGKFIDFMAIPEFRPFKDKLRLGNWLNVRQDGRLYRLRLVEIGYSSNDPGDLELVFSDLFKIRHSYNDAMEVISQAKKMGTTFAATAQKADWAKDRAEFVDSWVHNGLDLSRMSITDGADHQAWEFNKLGFWMRKWNDYSQSYEDEQVRTINNGIYYTPDNWQTIKAGLGKYLFPDPRNDYKVTEGYGIQAETIVGQVVLSEDVGIWNHDGSILLNEHGYTQTVKDTENFKDGGSYFRINREKEGQKYDVINISDEKIMFNLPGGNFRVDTGKVDLNGTDLYLNASSTINMDSSSWNVHASHIKMDGSDMTFDASDFTLNSGNVNIKANAKMTLETGSTMDLNAGSHLNLKGSEVNIESTLGNIELRAGSQLHLIGNLIDLKAAHIDMAGMTTINEAVKITEDGYLTAFDATFNDVKLNNIDGYGNIHFKDQWGAFSASGSLVKVNESEINAAGNAYFGNSITIGNLNKFGATYPTLLIGNGSLVLEDGNIDVHSGSVTSHDTFKVRNEMEHNSYINTFANQSAMQVYSDHGFGKIAEDGKCYIDIDPIFDVLVDGMPWVFVQGYYGAQVQVEYVDDVLFVVSGKPGDFFAWRMDSLKAGHEGDRLVFEPQQTNLIKDMDDSSENEIFEEYLQTQGELELNMIEEQDRLLSELLGGSL